LISTTISQPALAAIRFQFWRDALSSIWTGKTTDGKVATVPQHPVAVALAEMKAARPIQRYYLSQLIDTRVSGLSSRHRSRE
jgi:NADH dehydrogenase [ubiquinone] 1 alpha subcomplex assembly factor 6